MNRKRRPLAGAGSAEACGHDLWVSAAPMLAATVLLR